MRLSDLEFTPIGHGAHWIYAKVPLRPGLVLGLFKRTSTEAIDVKPGNYIVVFSKDGYTHGIPLKSLFAMLALWRRQLSLKLQWRSGQRIGAATGERRRLWRTCHERVRCIQAALE